MMTQNISQTFPTAIHQKIHLANLGQLPNAIIRLKSGWVIMGDIQPLPGYCLLLSDPVVSDLNFLNDSLRSQYLLDMTRVGDALLSVTNTIRINYETYGNLDPALHTHIIPRYKSESDDRRVTPAMKAYDWKMARPFSTEQDGPTLLTIRDYLKRFA